MLSDFTAAANAIAATTKKSQKESILATYLSSLDDADLERAAVFFAGSPFPRREQRVTGVGGAILSDAVVEASGCTHEQLREAWPKYADFGDVVAEFFSASADALTLLEAAELFDRLANAAGSGEKRDELVTFLKRCDAQSARFIVKILLSEFRIGLQEGLVESAIARAFDRPLDAVRRANMFTGDIGAAALLARAGRLESAQLSLFHPFASMLAQPEEDPADIVAALGPGALADDKYDGIRAQVHTDGKSARIFSRTMDDITHRFPEVEQAALNLGHVAILDGEIVAFSDRILPFAVIQTRLGRRKVTLKLLADAPVAFFAFDLLYLDGTTLFEAPLRERIERLRVLIARQGEGALRMSTQSPIRDAAHIDELFDAARGRANEGLVIKDPESIYIPGRRGKSWLKYKKALATLDCIVTFAQYGNGKRRGVLSDVTFGVRRDGDVVTIGKAYSGLTDAEIAMLTERFKANGEWLGWGFRVAPDTVLEIAFDRIQESKRHKSGFALRFPRIARIRDDKTVDEISTIDDVRRIYEGQLKREGPVSSGDAET